MKQMKISFLLVISFALISQIACDLDVPIKEMVGAKYQIKRAYEVKADKYDSENLKKSIKHLYKSHVLLKKEKDKDAKEEVLKSLKSSKKAIDKSLPLLSKDSLDDAKKIYSEAEKLFSEKFAPDEFTKSGNQIKESEKLNVEKKYWDSHLKSKEAIASGESAINKANIGISNLKGEITKLSFEKDMLMKNKHGIAAKKELDLVKQNLNNANNDILEKKIKDAVNKVDEAKKNMKQAKEKISFAAKKSSLKKQIVQLKNELEAIKSSKGAKFALEDINSTEASLKKAEKFLEEKNIDETKNNISNAEQSLKSAKDKSGKGLATEKIKSVETLLTDLKNKDKKNKHKEKINDATVLITQSKELLEKGSYSESIQKADEAESVLKIVGTTIEKERKIRISRRRRGITEGGKNTYTVVYNKNNTDCLWRISQKVYKNAKLWPYIYRANKDQIKDPDLIFPGQRLRIPTLSSIKKTGKKKKDNKSETKVKKEIKKQ